VGLKLPNNSFYEIVFFRPLLIFLPMPSDPSVEIFKQNWTTYQKLIANNYMFHQQRNSQADLIIQGLGNEHKIRVLDLGCGDAYWVQSLPSRDCIKSYTGIDLSPAALEYAIYNLEDLGFETNLHTGRMEELILQEKGGFQLVYSAYAIHHLQDEIKQGLFEDIFYRLEEGGVFILIDVFRKPGQSREDYLKDYITNVELCWTALEPHDLSLISSHILQFDFPAPMDKIQSWTETIGFNLEQAEIIDDYHKMLILSK
jgi:ubiquinone/menaquinone biosynthesis C-methylase UbiE